LVIAETETGHLSSVSKSAWWAGDDDEPAGRRGYCGDAPHGGANPVEVGQDDASRAPTAPTRQG
jgi:hypothetical protein